MSSQPSETAFLGSVLPEFTKYCNHKIPLRVLASPSNFHNLERMYSQIPSVETRPFRLLPHHLNISAMLLLMNQGNDTNPPLYMTQITKVLRDMAIESRGNFDYFDFRRRLELLGLVRLQSQFLDQRLDLLESYLNLNRNRGTGSAEDYFVDGGVTILDLSCPFMDQNTACILFQIAIDLFLHAHPSRGKLIVADEAHKFMSASNAPAARSLTETFLNIIRQQRHLGTRIIISTQEPTISPRLIDLCSITVVHRFSSPEWYSTIERHIPVGRRLGKGSSTTTNGYGYGLYGYGYGNGEEEEDAGESTDGLHQIASLRTGEAFVFAPSAWLLDRDGQAVDLKQRVFKMVVRKRVTWDGGKTILCTD